MNYISVAESFVSSILAAIFIAGAVWLFSWLRNIKLEKKLKNAINPNGVTIGFDPVTHEASFTLQVHNYANATIRVRSIVFISDRFHIELEPDPDRRIYQTPLTNEMIQRTFKRRHLSKGALEQDNNPYSVLLPPKTMSFWRVHPENIGKFEWIITDVYIAFEYATIFGNGALIRMRIQGQVFKSIKESFERLARSAHTKQPFDFHYQLRNEA